MRQSTTTGGYKLHALARILDACRRYSAAKPGGKREDAVLELARQARGMMVRIVLKKDTIYEDHAHLLRVNPTSF
jgi:hypothetical protein